MFFTELVPYLGCWQAARRMHNHMTAGVLRAPFSFFETTPQGRIVGRYAKDIDVIDTGLPMYISDSVYCLFQVSQLPSSILATCHFSCLRALSTYAKKSVIHGSFVFCKLMSVFIQASACRFGAPSVVSGLPCFWILFWIHRLHLCVRSHSIMNLKFLC